MSQPPSLASSGDDEFFWVGVEQHKLLLRQCATCAEIKHPPVPMCPTCGSLEWRVIEAAGRGEVHSWIVSHHPSEPEAPGRVVALVELVEGVRIVANLYDVEPADVRNDMAVEVTYAEYKGASVHAFRPSRSGV